MEVFLQEMKKVFWKNKILVWFFIFFILRGIFGMYIQSPNQWVDTAIEKNKSIYMEVINKIEGSWSPEKEKILKDLKEKNSKAETDIFKAGEENLAGEITDEEYNAVCMKYPNDEKIVQQIEMLEPQYDYIKEDTNHRYFLYENGWNHFFGNCNMDYWMIFLLCLSIPNMFCRDYETDMYRINRVTKRGNSLYFGSKIIIGSLFAILCSVCYWIQDLLISQYRFGLKHWEYPLQSLSVFKNASWKFTIGQTAIMELGIAILGAVFFTITMQFTSILFKKNIFALITGLVITILPQYIWEDSMLCSVPLPTAYLTKQGFIFGIMDKQHQRNFYTLGELGGKSIEAIMIIIMILFISYILYSKKSIKKIVKRSLPIFVVVAMLSLFGCGKTEEKEESVIYNYISWGNFVQGEDYFVNGGEKIFTYIKNGEEHELFVNPFFSEEVMEKCTLLNAQGEKVYYIQEKEDWEYDLCMVNIYTGETKTLYSYHTMSVPGQDYLNIAENRARNNIKKFYGESKDNSWVDGDTYYYILKDKLIAFSLSKETEKVILENIESGHIIYKDGTVFYVNSTNYELWSYEVKTGVKKKITDKYMSSGVVSKEGFLFQNGKKEIYEYNKDTKKIKKIAVSKGNLAYVDGNYYYTVEDKIVYRYVRQDGNLEGECKVKERIIAIEKDWAEDEIYVLVSGQEEQELIKVEETEWK